MPTVVEILEAPALAPRELRLLDLHSVLNALHAVYGEVYLIGHTNPKASVSEYLEGYCETITELCESLGDQLNPVAFLHEILVIAGRLERTLSAVESRLASASKSSMPSRSTAPLRRILGVVRVRIGELLQRHLQGRRWQATPVSTFVDNLTTVFEAIQEHSGGRFGIAFDRRDQGGNDYLIEIQVEGRPLDTLFVPAEFADVIRDLTANARKYTAPGGTISVSIQQLSGHLKVSIRDTGIGIPPTEIPEIVHFGRRGSNVAARRTLGGGFGLTKAVSLVKSWGGRFWIASELTVGTEVRFEVPLPAPAERTAC